MVVKLRFTVYKYKLKKERETEYLPTQEPQSAAPGDPSGLSK